MSTFPTLQLDYTDATHDPEGSVSIFRRTKNKRDGSYGYENPCAAGFDKFNSRKLSKKLKARGVRVTGVKSTTLSQVHLS